MDIDPWAHIASEFSVLIMQPTSLCNLNCAYCYLPDRRSRNVMVPEVAAADVGAQRRRS